MIRFGLVLALLPSLAWGQAAVTYADRSGTVTVGATAQSIMPAWNNRHGCFVQNQSTGDLWVSTTGTAAAVQPAVRVPAGAIYSCGVPASGGALSLYGATTGQAFAAREW